jgi:hypothetical protein
LIDWAQDVERTPAEGQMLNDVQLKLLLHSGEITSRLDKLLLLLACEAEKPKPVMKLKELAIAAGLREIQQWNVSDTLGKSGGIAILTPTGWELNASGRERVRALASLADINLVVTTASASLRAHLDRIKDPATRAFVGEAIVCFEARQYRAAVVFSWVGALSIIYAHVVANHLAAFNAEGLRRESNKWRIAKNADDLSRKKEQDFLDIIESIGVIGKNVKQVLQNHCLQLRNSCGHPNSLIIAENSVAAHIEKLILNVFSRFSP